MYTWNKNNVHVQDIILRKNVTFCRSPWLFCYLDYESIFVNVNVSSNGVDSISVVKGIIGALFSSLSFFLLWNPKHLNSNIFACTEADMLMRKYLQWKLCKVLQDSPLAKTIIVKKSSVSVKADY